MDYFLPLPEKMLNDNSKSLLSSKSYKKERKYLNQKRRRIKMKENSIEIENKIKSEEDDLFKFQYFSKNALSVIFSYLNFDDILKLKNIGCRNVYNYINELIEIKRSKGCFKLNLSKTVKQKEFILEYGSIPCKKYFYSNITDMDNISPRLNIRYILFHKESNKNYYLIKTSFNYYFCACETDKVITRENWKDDLLFKIEGYIEKFQFIDDNKVVFFSLNKLLLYDLSNENYNHNSIYLEHCCDFILIKKNLKLLIVPHISYKTIAFYSLGNNYPKSIRKIKCKTIVEHNTDCECENWQIINLLGNYICYFYSCANSVKIFDCKKMEIKKIIKLNYNIKNVELNNKYLIVYTMNNSLTFFDIATFVRKYSFNLIDCDIKYISTFEPSYLDNIFFVVTNSNKIYLMHIGNNSYYSSIPLDNELNTEEIKNNQFIGNSLIKEIKDNNDNINMLEFNTKIIYCDNHDYNKEYIINDYSLLI